eukprot:COSAG05_NODE_4973_length_1305_cov_7.012108_1_plen_326_part_10
MPPDLTSSSWERDGFEVWPGIFDEAAVAALREVVEGCLGQWRGSEPSAQPGGHADAKDANWIMLHLNHPQYHQGCQRDLALLLDSVCHPALLGALAHIFRSESSFHMLQTNLYVNPDNMPAPEGNWHRDSQFFASGALEGRPTSEQLTDPAEIDEREKLIITEEATPTRECHMHIALVDSNHSSLVPGSHRRWDTPGEWSVRKPGGSLPVSGDMPGSTRLQLSAGDVAFFHVNCLHRGAYWPAVPRRTIAVTWRADSSEGMRWTSLKAHPSQAQMTARSGYVASYQPWMALDGYFDRCAPATVDVLSRTVALYSPAHWGGGDAGWA